MLVKIKRESFSNFFASRHYLNIYLSILKNLNKLRLDLARGTYLQPVEEKAMTTIEDRYTLNHKSPLQTHACTHTHTHIHNVTSPQNFHKKNLACRH
jgi:hypothetical protein